MCISCDAGMCRSYFHVTCAQREGLLSEAAAEEVMGSVGEAFDLIMVRNVSASQPFK